MRMGEHTNIQLHRKQVAPYQAQWPNFQSSQSVFVCESLGVFSLVSRLTGPLQITPQRTQPHSHPHTNTQHTLGCTHTRTRTSLPHRTYPRHHRQSTPPTITPQRILFHSRPEPAPPSFASRAHLNTPSKWSKFMYNPIFLAVRTASAVQHVTLMHCTVIIHSSTMPPPPFSPPDWCLRVYNVPLPYAPRIRPTCVQRWMNSVRSQN